MNSKVITRLGEIKLALEHLRDLGGVVTGDPTEVFSGREVELFQELKIIKS